MKTSATRTFAPRIDPVKRRPSLASWSRRLKSRIVPRSMPSGSGGLRSPFRRTRPRKTSAR